MYLCIVHDVQSTANTDFITCCLRSEHRLFVNKVTSLLFTFTFRNQTWFWLRTG